jgi:hypothetical protein
MSFSTVRHELPAGRNFTGSTPDGTQSVDQANELRSFTEGTKGGKFGFSTKERAKLRRVLLDVTTASSWAISLTSRGVTAELFNSTNFSGNTVVISGPELALLDRSDTIELVTVGATGPISAEVTFEGI